PLAADVIEPPQAGVFEPAGAAGGAGDFVAEDVVGPQIGHRVRSSARDGLSFIIAYGVACRRPAARQDASPEGAAERKREVRAWADCKDASSSSRALPAASGGRWRSGWTRRERCRCFWRGAATSWRKRRPS